MSRRIWTTAVGGIGLLSLGLSVTPAMAAAPGGHENGGHGATRHVLLLSVDGLHQTDLAWYATAHPSSALAGLVSTGTNYTSAKTTFPSDSFPGMVAQVTGGTPGTTGIFYDDTYNRDLLPPGTLDCTSAIPGTEVGWTEAADRSQNPITLDAGQALKNTSLTALPANTKAATLADSANLTAGILAMTPTPQTLLDPAALPVNPATCLPLYPHQYLRTNTVFEVARSHGLRTAWSDKHAAYEILSGPSGTGVQDLFTPEINSVADNSGDDWTTDNSLTREYDGFKAAAVLNEIDGFDHSGTHKVGTPAIFGMNFQSVSTAEKLPVSGGLTGGYLADGTPGPLLSGALDSVNGQVGAMLARINQDGLASNTTVILSAKHGQSPENLSLLRRVNDGAVLDGLNTAWAAAHPGSSSLVTFSTDDDVMLLWLSDPSPAALDFAKTYLLSHSAPANVNGDPKGVYSATVASSGLTSVYTGADADHYVGAAAGDDHVPDLIGITQVGVVYTSKVAKISEHGGNAPQDRDVALVVAGSGAPHRVVTKPVMTTQIAPTILALLGLNPRSLHAVRAEHTKTLPGLG